MKNGKFHANFTLLGRSADNSRRPFRNSMWGTNIARMSANRATRSAVQRTQGHRLTTSLAPYRGQGGPFGPEKIPKKSKKSSRGLSAPGSKKVDEKRSKKGQKRVQNSLFSTFLTFFRLFFQPFLTPGPRGPGNFFQGRANHEVQI